MRLGAMLKGEQVVELERGAAKVEVVAEDSLSTMS
jgi:hypothetical protein